MLSEIFNVISVFPGDTFSTWKIESKLCCNRHSCRTHFIDLEYLQYNRHSCRTHFIDLEYRDYNQQNISNLSNSLRENWLHVFSSPPEKGGKENNFWGKDKFVLFPYTGLKIRLNFATIFSRLRDSLIEIFTIKNSWLWKYRSRSWCTTFPVLSFDGKYMTSHLMAVVMFSSSFHRLRNIRDARKKCKNLGLEDECQRQRVDERNLG